VTIDSYDDLKAHIGHDIELAWYGGRADPVNITIECETCSLVLIDYNRPIPAVMIELPFTEAPVPLPHGPFQGPDCWDQANRWLRLVAPPNLGYYKTDFTVTYEDDTTYEGRYDIGADAPTLGQHIRDHLTFIGNTTFAVTYQIGP
jgi:hypothetical protein